MRRAETLPDALTLSGDGPCHRRVTPLVWLLGALGGGPHEARDVQAAFYLGVPYKQAGKVQKAKELYAELFSDPFLC
jgi:hypothetical protein